MEYDESLSQTPQNISRCTTWAHILDDKRKKLDEKIQACIMMGYSKYLKAYELFDLVKCESICMRDVFFDENIIGITLLNSSYGLLSS
jgi:hypothetical protein